MLGRRCIWLIENGHVHPALGNKDGANRLAHLKKVRMIVQLVEASAIILCHIGVPNIVVQPTGKSTAAIRQESVSVVCPVTLRIVGMACCISQRAGADPSSDRPIIKSAAATSSKAYPIIWL